jgi:ribokinase
MVQAWAMRVAVVGHVEWVEFVRVDHVPLPGEIVHAESSWQEPGGGGAASAVQLAKLAGEADFYTALGDDALGRRAAAELEQLGVRVHATFRPEATRRAFTHVDRTGERTITVIGERLGPLGREPLPWADLESADAVYFTAGDEAALRAARAARVLVATARAQPVLTRSGVQLDALVGSANDPSEAFDLEDVSPPPRLGVWTDGERGGTYAIEGRTGRYEAAELDKPIADRYGAGDSFAAGLTYALGANMPPAGAVALAARCGAAALTGQGPYAGQLRHEHL